MTAFLLDFMLRPLITAVRTLTILPMPGKDTETFSRTLIFFPLAGGLLALALFAIFAAGRVVFPDQNYLTAVLMVAGMALITGGLHLDGLADAADGFGSGKTPERMLEIMKDPRQGTFGVLALIIDILLKALLYYTLIGQEAILIVLLSIILGRGFQAPFMAFLPYARKEGGTARNFCGDAASRPMASLAFLAVMAVVFICMPVLSAGICFLAAVTVGGFFAWYCLLTIGGITGDCIGALNEIAELTFLLSAVIMKNLGV